jgi:hypothetical protein
MQINVESFQNAQCWTSGLCLSNLTWHLFLHCPSYPRTLKPSKPRSQHLLLPWPGSVDWEVDLRSIAAGRVLKNKASTLCWGGETSITVLFQRTSSEQSSQARPVSLQPSIMEPLSSESWRHSFWTLLSRLHTGGLARRVWVSALCRREFGLPGPQLSRLSVKSCHWWGWRVWFHSRAMPWNSTRLKVALPSLGRCWECTKLQLVLPLPTCCQHQPHAQAIVQNLSSASNDLSTSTLPSFQMWLKASPVHSRHMNPYAC